jgi:hypothetical protein
MKSLTSFPFFSIILILVFNVNLYANDDVAQDSAKGRFIRPEHIVVHPQPLSAGDAFISLNVPGKIISTFIYTVTGERILKDYHNSSTTAVKYIPYSFRKGEYLLKVYTEDGVGLRRILFADKLFTRLLNLLKQANAGAF